MRKLISAMAGLMASLIGLASCSLDTVAGHPAGRHLRDIVSEKFPDRRFSVGVTCGLWAFDHACGDIVDREFSYVTPETDFKQSTIHPNNNDWNLANARQWVERIAIQDQIMRMHCPIGPQVSDWTENDNRTAAELDTNMTEFLTTVCQTFNDVERIKYLDVVNETVQAGEWFGPKSGAGAAVWENPWPKIGSDTDANQTPLYIKKAFAISNQYAPRIKQLYNHHEGPEVSASWDLIKETIAYLRDRGLRVDAIGWQAHVDNGWATESHLAALRDLIDWAQANGLEFHVTEASSYIKTLPTEAELAVQADTYAAIFQAVMAKSRTGIVSWNTWHLTDAYTYRSEFYPALFDAFNQPKPAYYAIQKSLEAFE